MSRLTHALWSILDEELDSHGYFTTWLNLNEKMRKSIQGQVKKVKKVKFSLNKKQKTKTCFWSRITSEIQWYHYFSCKRAITLIKLQLNVWRHHWALWGRQKHPFWGKTLLYRVETLHTGWRPLDLQHIFLFLKILKILDFVIIFLKKMIFWNFWGKKSKM